VPKWRRVVGVAVVPVVVVGRHGYGYSRSRGSVLARLALALA
jgi:hypothetical protein